MPTKPATARHRVGRFAHPFFTSTPPSERQPVNGLRRMTDWSRQHLGPIPPIKRDGIMTLADVIGDAGAAQIESVGQFRFHALGDSGVGSAHEAELVSEEMAGDYTPTGGGLNPAFLFHLGDVIYGNGKEAHYTDRFFRPYRHYPGKIIAIPGNHDGEVRSADDKPSLSGFQSNFCLPQAGVPEAASSVGIYREMAAQPGVYWMLDAPLVRIIGLYSNLLENPGYLQGKTNGKNDTSQLDWLERTLSTIKQSASSKALVVATHHPPYSSGGHSGSQEMNDDITKLCADTGVLPDLFLSAHAHNYQRYTRVLSGKKITYIVAGTGGMPPQPLPDASGQPSGVDHEVTYDAALSSLGYLYVTVTKDAIQTEFWPLGGPSTPFDPNSLPLQ
jgi:calcineurin-like phosphoesterase family protein